MADDLCAGMGVKISCYIDGELEGAALRGFLDHLAVCPSCREALAEAERAEAVLKQGFPPLLTPPSDFTDRVMADLPDLYRKEAQPAQVLPLRKKYVWVKRVGALAAGLVIVIGMTVADPFHMLLVDPPAVNVGDTGKDPTPPAHDPDPVILDPGTVEDPGDSTTVTLPEGEATGSSGETGEPNEPAPPPVKPGQGESNSESGNKPAETKPAAGENEGTAKPETEKPAPEPEPSIQGEIRLPQAAFSAQGVGSFDLRLVASHDGCDVSNAVINSSQNMVSYYLAVDGMVQLWQVDWASGNEPEFVKSFDASEVEAADAAAQGSEVVSAFSPDGSMLAALTTDDAEGEGLWLTGITNEQSAKRIFDKPCGTLLSWAPNSGKLVFTDQGQSLYVAYPAEDVVSPVAMGDVKQVFWLDRGTTLLFLMRPDPGKPIGLYIATLP